MPKPYGFATEHPRLVLGVALLATLLLAPGLLRLELRTDGAALVPAGAPEIAIDDALRARFDLRDRIAVVLEAPGREGIYRAPVLAAVARLSAACAALEGVGAGHVESLASEPSDRVHAGSLSFRPWLDPLPATESELARLRRDLEESGIYAGTLIAGDRPASATAVLVGVPPGADRPALVRRVTAEAQRAAGEVAGLRVHVVGAPVAEALLGAHILGDLARLVPIAVVVMAAVFALAFRSLPAVVLPLVEVGACLVMTLALMGWLGAPVYLTIAILPVILTAVGVADELHVFTCFLGHLRSAPGAPLADAVRATLDEMSRPVVLTSLTTALGFLSFALSPVAPVRVFGVFMAVGVLLCLAWTLLVIPACLVLVPRARWGRAGSGADRALASAGGRLAGAARAVLAHRAACLFVFAALAAAAALAATRLRVQDSWVSGFKPDSAFARSTRRVNELFGGTHLLQLGLRGEAVRAHGVVERSALRADTLLVPGRAADDLRWLAGHAVRLSPVPAQGTDVPALERRIASAEAEGEDTRLQLEAGRVPLERWLPSSAERCAYEIDGRGRFEQPALLELAGELERSLARLAELEVGRVLGPHEHLATMSFMWRGRDPAARRVPRDAREVRLVLEHYARVRGAERLRRVLAADGTDALVTVFVKDADFARVARLIAAVRAFERERLAPLGVRVDVGGDLARSQAMVGGIVRTQTSSLAYGLLAVALTAALVSRSIGWGILCAAPAAFAVVIDLGLLGALGVPLGVATSMFAGMTIGIGVDFAIHLVARVRRARATGLAAADAWADAHARVGPAVAIDAAALALGFGVLTLSSVPANARLGVLMAASLAACLVASLVLVPALAPGRSR